MERIKKRSRNEETSVSMVNNAFHTSLTKSFVSKALLLYLLTMVGRNHRNVEDEKKMFHTQHLPNPVREIKNCKMQVLCNKNHQVKGLHLKLAIQK